MSLRTIQIPAARRPNGSVDRAARVRITLMGADGRPLLGQLDPDGAPISGYLDVRPGVSGATAQLTPNTEIAPASYYAIVVRAGQTEAGYTAQIGASDAALTWLELIGSAEPLDAADLSALAAHIADDTRHLTADQVAAIDAANNPSAANPVATVTDVVAAGGGDMHSLIYDPRGIAADTFTLDNLTGNLDGGTF